MFSTKSAYWVPKEKRMFTAIRFTMVNSIGTPVSVNLYNEDGLVDYEIFMPNLGVKDSKRRSLGHSGSARFLDKLKKSGFIYFIESFANSDATENEGDFWDLGLELENGEQINIHGPRPEESVLYPFIQDFSELLDWQFSITQFVSPSRVDKLEIAFIFNEMGPDFLDATLRYEQCDHTETVILDRSSFTFSYQKRFPASCYHSAYKCKCEQQVRQILDQTSEALDDERVFEDVYETHLEHPVVQFKFTFHDGSTAKVNRSLCSECLRDQLYIEMIDVLFVTSLNLMYKGGIFDKRFLLGQSETEDAPFSVQYEEGREMA